MMNNNYKQIMFNIDKLDKFTPHSWEWAKEQIMKGKVVARKGMTWGIDLDFINKRTIFSHHMISNDWVIVE